VLDESLRLEIARLENTGAKSTTEGAGGDRNGEIESHLNRLLKLLKKLESINDRADGTNSHALGSSQDFDLLVIAALREAECADLIEKTMEADLTDLCEELKRKSEGLQAAETALAKFKEASNAQLVELESRIQNQESKLRRLENEQKKLVAERDRLSIALSEAESAAAQAEVNAEQFKQRVQEEFAAVRSELENREEAAEVAQTGLVRIDADQQKEIENLQVRLQESEAKVAAQAKELGENERTIRAAGVREKELGKLIERLSAECEKLSAELYRNKFPPARAEGKPHRSFISGAKAKAARLLGSGRNSSDK
jgi:DNA repair exonuclease SbcCD ATPase subunit